MGKSASPRTVDEYIAAAPERARARLEEFRRIIKEVAPTATESISYNIPFYDYKGRLAWFGLHRGYVSLYLRPPVLEKHKKAVAGYETTISAIHFPLDEETPVALIQNLVGARMKMNEAAPE